ncbi:MAG: hypothetical protein HOP11_04230 [Saprospiraceae bacterium]|nr:hypothetical protein [Saprospiraceae bacterium]
MKRIKSILTILCCNLLQLTEAKITDLDLDNFYKMNPDQRFQYVQSLNLELLDTASFFESYHALMFITQKEKDNRTSWALRYEYFLQRENMKFSNTEMAALVEDLKNEAVHAGLEIEQVVAEHYILFSQFDLKEITYEQLYSGILKDLDRMTQLGFENFKPYDIDQLLFHSGKFIYNLDNYNKALDILLTAEKYAEPTIKGLVYWTYIKNHIETIYQKKKNYEKGLEYSWEIFETMQNCPSYKPDQVKFCSTWQGIVSIDIATMLTEQGKFSEGEIIADKGYELIKGDTQTLYDMLPILISTKLKLGKMDQVFSLLEKMEEIFKVNGKSEEYYFKNLNYFESASQYFAMKSNYPEALKYKNYANLVRDSLDRRNDANKLNKIQQLHDAQKYTQQILMIENEKERNKLLRNSTFLTLLFLLILSYVNYRKLSYKQKLSILQLESARNALNSFTANIREKSELAERLQAENERLMNSGERNEFLEALTHSTLLTEEAWLTFRNLFEKVYPGYLDEQRNIHKNTSPADLRLMALEKLGLSDREAAKILGISSKSVHQARWRLHKKLIKADS